MKRHLNTLFITTQGAYLHRDGEAVSVKVDGETKLRVPIHNLGSIICFGNVLCSPFAMGLCSEHNVHLAFLTEQGRFLGRIDGKTSGNVLLRREHYRRADDLDLAADIARAVVIAKLINSRTVLQRASRENANDVDRGRLATAARELKQHLSQLADRTPTLDTIRGIEGAAARTYFGVFQALVVKQRSEFSFVGRNRRPAKDPVNSLLSFVYTLLRHDAESALEAVGLDSKVGFLHRDRPGRPGLALDLMEEFRAFLADRIVLSVINRRQVKAKGFTTDEAGAVWMDDETRKAVLVAYQERKQDEITHPFLGERTTVGLLVHLQARLLTRYLRGDLDAYPAFIWK